jgi:hypothetical protein
MMGAEDFFRDLLCLFMDSFSTRIFDHELDLGSCCDGVIYQVVLVARQTHVAGPSFARPALTFAEAALCHQDRLKVSVWVS